MSKRVILIGPAYPYRGGIAAFNENLASVFQKNGWEVQIFTFTQQYPNFLFPGKNQLATDDKAPNLNIKRAIYSTNPLNWLKITKEIVALEPDLLITQYWMPFMAPAFGTIIRGVKKSFDKVFNVTIVHNFKPHESLIGEKQLGRYLANRTDLMVSLSQNVAEDIARVVPNVKVKKLFHPIYDHYGDKIDKQQARKTLGLDQDCVYFLFFGLVRSYKGLDLLIQALSLVKSQKKFKLLIAGEFYENETKYLSLIEELDLGDKITIVNEYIANDKVPLYFCAADAVTLPYKRATQSGVVPIAIHFDKPVIVTEVGDLSTVIKTNEIGLISEPGAEELAENLESFLENGSYDTANFIPVKQQLSWQNFLDTFVDEIKEHGFGDQ